MRWPLRIRKRATTSAEERAAIQAARASKASAEQARAEADETEAENARQVARVRRLRVDNHLGFYLVEFARRGEGPWRPS
jgi:hypothetical protein